jgi:acyl-CoA thioesterase
LDVRRYLFVNTDLSVHLLRMPEGDWVCLDACTYPERNGVGLADTALYDQRGRIGRAAQTLLVRAR